jgi:hypothetical protein
VAPQDGYTCAAPEDVTRVGKGDVSPVRESAT